MSIPLPAHLTAVPPADGEATTDQPQYHQEAVDVKTKYLALKLHHSWDLYHIDPSQIAKGIWEPSIISTFGNIHDFWCIFNNIAMPSYLPFNTYLYMFKHGIAPKWEDEDNKHGGELNMIFDQHQAGGDIVDEAWLHTVLAIVGEYFTQSDNINGLCCSSKQKFIKISIWVKNANPQSYAAIVDEWAKNLNTQPTDIKFKAFK